VECEPTSIAVVRSVCPDSSPQDSGKSDRRVARKLTIGLEPFAWEALEQESAKQGVSIAELASFAVLYYLADGDSGRIARRLRPPSQPGEPHPLGKLLDS
jgi:hypothetical protein